MQSYRRQIGMILPFRNTQNPAKLMRNSKWLGRLRLPDVIRIASHATVQQFLERDMFQRRLNEQKPIALHEFLYPLLQGYDSVALDADAEVGGADQLFNMLVGKKLCEAELGKRKFVIALRLLEDPATGKKMSKSEGNYIPLSASPEDMYGKVMALPDSMVWVCFELATEMPDADIHVLRQKAEKGESMRNIKAILAERIVASLYSADRAQRAREQFRHMMEGAIDVTDAKSLQVPPREKAVDFVARARQCSKSQAARLIEGGALHLYARDTKRMITVSSKDALIDFAQYQYVRIGKKKTGNFYTLKIVSRK
jgi:tyrosyl-tRNA synthetase